MITKSRLTVFFVAVICLFAANNAFALSYVFNNANGNWAVPANWSITPATGLIPGSADVAFIRGSRIATISSDAGSVNGFFIGDTLAQGPTGTVNIVAGGNLSVLYTGTSINTRPSLGRPGSTTDGSMGIMNISGGTLTMAGGAGLLYVGTDTDPSAHITGRLTISGGTFNGRLLVGSTNVADSVNDDLVRIVGSAATIETTSTVGYALEMASGKLEFIFDAAGISTMNYGTSGSGGTATFGVGSKIIVDGAAYVGGDATFNLITAGTLGTQNATVILTNCAAGTTYSWNTTTDILSVNMKGSIVKGLKLFMVK